MPTPLPESPNLDWLRKQAKRRLEELQRSQPAARLADAQYALARDHGFSSWRSLKAHVDSLTLDGQLVEAATTGKVNVLRAALDKHPEKLHLRTQPYEWTLLHLAAQSGRLEIVDLLLSRGLDVNTLEKGDDTTAMHWAAAAGHVAVVRRLADAGGDVIGHGDDHELEVIGWATCWDGCDDDAHRAVVEELMRRGARHHIFSAVAMNLAGEVREIVARDRTALSRKMSRFEDFRQPLHFAVRQNRPAMVELLIELGADPAGKDGSGLPPIAYATSPSVDRAIHEALWTRGEKSDLFTALALGEWAEAERLLREDPGRLARSGVSSGTLHLMAKRNNLAAVRWLLEHGADVSGLWDHWDSAVTALHLAIMVNHPDMVQLLLDAGADTYIKDSKHDSDAMGWAEFFERRPLIDMVARARARG
jgi:ankyrin repeat protein